MQARQTESLKLLIGTWNARTRDADNHTAIRVARLREAEGTQEKRAVFHHPRGERANSHTDGWVHQSQSRTLQKNKIPRVTRIPTQAATRACTFTFAHDDFRACGPHRSIASVDDYASCGGAPTRRKNSIGRVTRRFLRIRGNENKTWKGICVTSAVTGSAWFRCSAKRLASTKSELTESNLAARRSPSDDKYGDMFSRS